LRRRNIRNFPSCEGGGMEMMFIYAIEKL